MVYVSLHWREHWGGNLILWGFAVKHAVLLHKIITNLLSGLLPIEWLIKTKAYCNLLCTHVSGCWVYVLDPKIQDGIKISSRIDWCSLFSCHHLLMPHLSITCYLMTFAFSTDSFFCNGLFASGWKCYNNNMTFFLMTPLCIIHLLLMKFGRMSLSTMPVALSSRDIDILMKIMNKSCGLIYSLMTILTYFQL